MGVNVSVQEVEHNAENTAWKSLCFLCSASRIADEAPFFVLMPHEAESIHNNEAFAASSTQVSRNENGAGTPTGMKNWEEWITRKAGMQTAHAAKPLQGNASVQFQRHNKKGNPYFAPAHSSKRASPGS